MFWLTALTSSFATDHSRQYLINREILSFLGSVLFIGIDMIKKLQFGDFKFNLALSKLSDCCGMISLLKQSQGLANYLACGFIATASNTVTHEAFKFWRQGYVHGQCFVVLVLGRRTPSRESTACWSAFNESINELADGPGPPLTHAVSNQRKVTIRSTPNNACHWSPETPIAAWKFAVAKTAISVSNIAAGVCHACRFFAALIRSINPSRILSSVTMIHC